jgi:hypothetical protein
MKEIDVQQQPHMGVVRTFSLTVNGIRYRLFRSAVTVGVIAVAIAFMMNVLSASLVKSSVATLTAEKTLMARKASLWAARLTTPGSPVEVIAAVASTRVGDPIYLESAHMGGISDAAMAVYHDQAKTAHTYLEFFGGLEYAVRKRLVPETGSDVDLIQVLDLMAVEGRRNEFWTTLKRVRSVRFVAEFSEFQEFFASWENVKAKTSAIREGRKKAVDQVADALGTRKIIRALADAEGEFGEAVRGAGFAFSAEEAAIVALQARDEIDASKLEETVSRPEARKLLATRLDIMPVEVSIDVVWDIFSDRGSTSWYFRELETIGVAVPDLFGVTDHESRVERAQSLAAKRRHKMDMARAERASSDVGGGILGMGERMTWLLVASMLVCVVGVTNAMLMSVTERFREIATLKCLGAMDDFIMMMFVFEAGILGLAGGILGAIAGGLIGVGRMFALFGTYLFALVPVTQIMVSIVLSIIVGMVLAAVGAVYPSFKAARLAPMEAMRIQ